MPTQLPSSPSPSGVPARSKRSPRPTTRPTDPGGEAIFVVHARDDGERFELRLEADGVLKSWVVPKGPSCDPWDRRLAIPLEDRPLAGRRHADDLPAADDLAASDRPFALFDGAALAGDDPSGTVWDLGSYRNETCEAGQALSITEALEAGHVVVRLDGEKLHGLWELLRIRFDGQPAWLLVKSDGGLGDREPTTHRSTLTGRTPPFRGSGHGGALS